MGLSSEIMPAGRIKTVASSIKNVNTIISSLKTLFEGNDEKHLINYLVIILLICPIGKWLKNPDSELKDIYKKIFVEEPISYVTITLGAYIALILRLELRKEYDNIWRLKKKEDEEDRQYKLRKQKQQEEQAKQKANDQDNQSREPNV